MRTPSPQACTAIGVAIFFLVALTDVACLVAGQRPPPTSLHCLVLAIATTLVTSGAVKQHINGLVDLGRRMEQARSRAATVVPLHPLETPPARPGSGWPRRPQDRHPVS